jgi:hypothetical protein
MSPVADLCLIEIWRTGRKRHENVLIQSEEFGKALLPKSGLRISEWFRTRTMTEVPPRH